MASLGAAVVGLAGLLAAAAPAEAHVSVSPAEAEAGSYAKLAFRVPNERDDSSTTKVEVALPTDHPLASVKVRPHPGWKVDVAHTDLTPPVSTDDGQVTQTVSRITWTSESPESAIGPGEFEEFEVSVGPLPEGTASVVFKVLQTYASGDVVRWIDEPVAGGAEPEHPAPVLTLEAGNSGGGDHHGSAREAGGDDGTGGNGKSASAEDGTARSRAATALTIALVALVFSIVGIGRARRQGAGASG